MGLHRIRLGDYIEASTKNNRDLKYGCELILGVNSDGSFTLPKGDVSNVDLKPYKLVNNQAFVYNPSRLDLGSIAFRTDGFCIVSHLYIVFYLNGLGRDVIDPTYLYVYMRRKEFLREVTFRNFGSQRPEFGFKDMCDIEIDLPPIEIQRQYAAVYEAMVANQKSYERGLEDLKLTCDAYIEKLMKEVPSQCIDPFITRIDVRNSDNSIRNVKGVSTSKQFRNPTSKVDVNELSSYKIVRPGQISFVQTTHNEKCFANALNDTDEDIVVTSVNEVFETDRNHLLPEYLVLFFNRAEFDRYARFHSWGSARETFTWDDLCNVRIPIAPLETQQTLANLYRAYRLRSSINEQLKQQIRDICPILIKGACEEAARC